MNSKVIVFDNNEVHLDVNVKDETVWLNADQIAMLFERDYKTIRKHINNIFNEELDKNSNSQKMRLATSDKPVEFYNLDVIISVGYRVKSPNGIIFRKWANKVLKDYLIQGYVINQKRMEYLEKTVKLINIAGRIDYRLENNEGQDIIKVIDNYSQALLLLDDYDHKVISKPKGNISDNFITYEECLEIIHKLKFNNDSDIFAFERDNGLKSIINNIYQSFDGKDLYPTVEEKAANFLYLITKNHVFIDGNKRIAATLFIYFLNFYNILFKKNEKIIDNNTLVALTLLIAQSNPKEKEILIDLVMNFLIKT
ncbi:MAG: virulence protein RhuM/Fic/DOC family protein [Bacilli bacterium]|nr:virulence protein RhuM/Fic/DOC family protein [Bacilli bacterium]